jgi:hypothetical protein
MNPITSECQALVHELLDSSERDQSALARATAGFGVIAAIVTTAVGWE